MTKDEMESLFIDDGIELTDDLSEAIYLFNNGLMVSGEYYDGLRGTDHRVLLDELDNSSTYEELHQNYKVARQVRPVKGLRLHH